MAALDLGGVTASGKRGPGLPVIHNQNLSTSIKIQPAACSNVLQGVQRALNYRELTSPTGIPSLCSLWPTTDHKKEMLHFHQSLASCQKKTSHLMVKLFADYSAQKLSVITKNANMSIRVPTLIVIICTRRKHQSDKN